MSNDEETACPYCGIAPFIEYSCDGCGEDGCTDCMENGQCYNCRKGLKPTEDE